MKVTMLGTGAADGWPSPFCDCASCETMRAAGKHRAPSSILIDDTVLVDCGPTAPHAAGQAGVSLRHVEHVLVTHGHPDHLHPAFLLAWQWAAPAHQLQVWGPPAALATCEHWVADGANVDFRALSADLDVSLDTRRGTYSVKTIPAAHAHGNGDVMAVEALLYAIESPDGQRLLYATDTGLLPEHTLKRLGRRFDAVLVENTFGAKDDHGHGHLDFTTLPTMMRGLRAVGAVDDDTVCIATHLGHHNPPPPQLHALLAHAGLVALDDLDSFDTAVGPANRPRRALVTGGARSGKSRYAEGLASEATHVDYVATALRRDGDTDWDARIHAHRARRPQHWVTHETTDIPAVLCAAITGTTVLVDCIGLWLTSLLDEFDAWDDDEFTEYDPRLAMRTDELVSALRACAGDVILVTNEAGLGVVPATRAGRLFRDCLGRTNAALAEVCEDVVLLVAGVPVTIRSTNERRQRT